MSFMESWIENPTAANITANVDYLCIMFYQKQDDSCLFTGDGMKSYITDLWTGLLGFQAPNIVVGLSATNSDEIQQYLTAIGDAATGGMTRWLSYCSNEGLCIHKDNQDTPTAWVAWNVASCTASTYSGNVKKCGNNGTQGHPNLPCDFKSNGITDAQGCYTVKQGEYCQAIAQNVCGDSCRNDFTNILCNTCNRADGKDAPQPNTSISYDCTATSPCTANYC